MPPDTLWSGNSNGKVSSIAYDDASTTYDAAIPYDGIPAIDIPDVYVPNPVAYSDIVKPNATTWTIPNPL